MLTVATIDARATVRCRAGMHMGMLDELFWPSSPAVATTVAAICREDGWDVRCTLGLQAARGLRSRAEDRSGGPLPAAMQEST
jgi:hypothetical protein